MRKLTFTLILAALIPSFAVVPAFAIVDPVTPLTCVANPAVGASGNSAGGKAAAGKVNVNGGRSLPIADAQGKAKACP